MDHAYVPPQPPMRNPSNGLATGGFVVALIGALLSLIPIIGTISWLLAPIGLILSAVGLGLSGRRGAGKGLGIAGILLGIVGLIFCIAYTAAFANAVRDTPAPNFSAPAVPAVSQAPSAPKAAAGTFTAGTYEVGKDIQAGRYKTSGGTFCGWSRNKSDDGQFDSIIANQIVQGPGSVTVKASDAFVEFSGDCTWTKQ